MDHDPRNPAYIATQGPLPHTVADFWQVRPADYIVDDCKDCLNVLVHYSDDTRYLSQTETLNILSMPTAPLVTSC